MRIKKPANFIPETNFPDDHLRWPGKPRCQSWNPNQGRQCSLPPIRGKIRCGSHGGKTPSGAASPHFKHGRFSEALSGSQSLKDLYEENLQREGQLCLDDEIAITDARIQELFAAAVPVTGDLLELLTAMRESFQELCESLSENDPYGIAVNTKKLGDKIDQAIDQGQQKVGLDKREDQLFERRRRLTETEARRLNAAEQQITVSQLVAIFANFGFEMRDVLIREIDDLDRRRRLLASTEQIMEKYMVGGQDDKKLVN